MVTVTKAVNTCITDGKFHRRKTIKVDTEDYPFDTIHQYMDHLFDGELDEIMQNTNGTPLEGIQCYHNTEHDRYDVYIDHFHMTFSTSEKFRLYWLEKLHRDETV